MYGYFLKRVDESIHPVKTMKILPYALHVERRHINQAVAEEMRTHGGEASAHVERTHPEISFWSGYFSPGSFGLWIKPSRLWTYMMSFDAETLQRYTTVRSKETVGIRRSTWKHCLGACYFDHTSQRTINSSKDVPHEDKLQGFWGCDFFGCPIGYWELCEF